MKQGQASSSGPGSRKIEPRSHATSPTAVAQLGIMQGNHTEDNPNMPVRHHKLYEGRGYEAPMAGSEVHRSGSQGKHK